MGVLINWELFLLCTAKLCLSGRTQSSDTISLGYYSPSFFSPIFTDVTGRATTNATRRDILPWLKQPLWGVAYVPYRGSISCHGISKEDIVQDLNNISEVAFQVYVPEMYCHFGEWIVEHAGNISLRMILGLSLRSEVEFERQYSQLERIFRSDANLTRVSAISVGCGDLNAYLDNPEFVIQALNRVKNLINSSHYNRINVTTADSQNYLFDQPWTHLLDAYIVLVNVVGTTRTPASAVSLAWQAANYVKIVSARIDSIEKRVYVAGIGWPSAGDERVTTWERGTIRRKSTNVTQTIVGNATSQAEFVGGLVCLAHRRDNGLRYFYYYGYDPDWLDLNSTNQRTKWGLFDRSTNALKPALIEALNATCEIVSSVPSASVNADNVDNGRQSRKLTRIVLFTVACVIVFGVMVFFILFFWRRKKQADQQMRIWSRNNLSNDPSCNTDSDNASSTRPISKLHQEEYIGMIETMYNDVRNMIDPKHIIPAGDIQLKEVIGEGHFGIVQRATMKKDNEEKEVAVKRLHDGASRNVRQFISEGLRMENFHHKNVLHLIGIYYINSIPTIVVPFMEKNNLLSFVSDCKNNLTIRGVLEFAIQIADGMEYLHKLKLVHRDLAARNCMLDSSLTVKISDFGLCRDVSDSDSYHATASFELPVRWMAPETILKLQWTNKSDVWSYGVVIWELLTRGKQPYKDVLLVELRLYLEEGGRLAKPSCCPDIVYNFMKTCWHREPEERPEFSALRQALSGIIQGVDDGLIDGAGKYYNVIAILEHDNISPL